MTSYRFFKMAAIEVENILPGSVLVMALLWEDGTTGIPTVDEISQSTAEIKLLPVSENGRPPFWKSISDLPPNFRHRRVILHWPTEFRQNRTTLGGVMTSYRFFSRWRPAAILDLIWIILDHLQSVIVGLRLVLKFGLDRNYSFGDIAMFIF